MNYQRACALFAVDLGVDLRPFQAEITQCKRRFQQDLWNTICNRVLQNHSGWKEEAGSNKGKRKSEERGLSESGTRDEEEGGFREGMGEEDEDRPEESGENENNATLMLRTQRQRGGRGNWSNSTSHRSRGQQQLLTRKQGIVPTPLRQPQPPTPLRQPQPQQQQQQQQQWQQQQQQQQQQQWQQQKQQQQWQQQKQQQQWQQQKQQKFVRGELSQFLHRMQPQEGVLDWRRGGGGGRIRNGSNAFQRNSQQHHRPQQQQTRSYSATSKREILGCYEPVKEEVLDDSDGRDAFEVLGGGNTGYCSDGDTSTFHAHNGGTKNDAASNSSSVTKEFVPLLAGNWK